MCPKENCSQAYENVVQLQEHSVQSHGNVLSDDHRHDFYKNGNGASNGNGGVFAVGINDSSRLASDNKGSNDGNKKRDNNQKETGSGNKVQSYSGGKKTNDNAQNVTDDGDNDQDGSYVENGLYAPTDGGSSIFESMDTSNMTHSIDDDIDQERSLADILVENHPSVDGDTSIDRFHCDKCDFGTNDDSELKKHNECEHKDCDEADSVLMKHLTDDTTSLNTLLTDDMSIVTDDLTSVDNATSGIDPRAQSLAKNVIVVQPEDVDDSEPVSEEATNTTEVPSPVPYFATPGDPSVKKCTVCPYATIYSKSYRRHMETHEKFKSFTGNAFKCAFCAFISQAKSPTMKHIKTFHPDKPSKMFYVRLVGGKIVSEMEMMFEFGASAAAAASKQQQGGKYQGSMKIRFDDNGDHNSRGPRKLSVGGSSMTSSGVSSMSGEMWPCSPVFN